MLRVPDFPHDQRFQRTLKYMRHFRSDQNAAPRQADNNIHLYSLVQQVAAKLVSGVMT